MQPAKIHPRKLGSLLEIKSVTAKVLLTLSLWRVGVVDKRHFLTRGNVEPAPWQLCLGAKNF